MFVAFMASQNGRIARIVVGLVLVALGLFFMSGTAGWIVVIIGAIPLATGALNICFLESLLGSK